MVPHAQPAGLRTGESPHVKDAGAVMRRGRCSGDWLRPRLCTLRGQRRSGGSIAEGTTLLSPNWLFGPQVKMARRSRLLYFLPRAGPALWEDSSWPSQPKSRYGNARSSCGSRRANPKDAKTSSGTKRKGNCRAQKSVMTQTKVPTFNSVVALHEQRRGESIAPTFWGGKHDSIQVDSCCRVGTRRDIRNTLARTEEI